MSFTLGQFYAMMALYMTPMLAVGWLLQNVGFIWYKLKKLFKRGKFVRIFFFGENGTVQSGLVNIGNKYSSDVIEKFGKAFIFVKEDIRSLPRFLGKIAGEPVLFYNYNNIMPVDPIMAKQYNLDMKTQKKAFLPVKMELSNRKTPLEFYSALNSKGYIDIMSFGTGETKKKAIALGVILVVVAIGLYVLNKVGIIGGGAV